MAYKWSCPHEWLEDYKHEIIAEGGGQGLLSLVSQLARLIDTDALQDLFQEEMDADGYFEEVE